MKILRVEADQPYNVHIGKGAYSELTGEYLEILQAADKLVVVADEKVADLHLEYLLSFLKDFPVSVLKIPTGEGAKSIETFMDCHSFLLAEASSRKTVLLAFGGGATGDVAGFVASTFMRGIPYIQLPTTILAHDSAVGGKTAINHPSGKNMVGTFYQPAGVLYDVGLLDTLPPAEIRSGMAEVIKHAFISFNKTKDKDPFDDFLSCFIYGSNCANEICSSFSIGYSLRLHHSRYASNFSWSDRSRA